jgi:hypothetical protein
VRRVLGNLGLRDETAGRRAYGEYLQERVMQLKTKAGRKVFNDQWKGIRYGWFLGTDGFKDRLLQRVGQTVNGNQRASYGGEEIRRHDEHCAEALIGRGMKRLRIREEDLDRLAKGHEAKSALAWLAHTRTMASHQWLSDRLRMGNSTTVSTYIKRVKDVERGTLRDLREKLAQTVSVQ